jgi:hypothetical protein
VTNPQVLKRVGGAMAELLRRSVAAVARYGRHRTEPGPDATPVYTDKWSIQNEVHP